MSKVSFQLDANEELTDEVKQFLNNKGVSFAVKKKFKGKRGVKAKPKKKVIPFEVPQDKPLEQAPEKPKKRQRRKMTKDEKEARKKKRTPAEKKSIAERMAKLRSLRAQRKKKK